MVLCKTGQLFKSAVLWGAILGDATLSQKRALAGYIRETAIVFQIKDDLLDIDFLGGKRRDIGSDIRKGKKTLLMIHALKKADKEQRREILGVLGDEKVSDQKIKQTIKLLERLGSIDYCQTVARQRIKKAIKYLDEARPAFDGEAKKFFKNLAYFMLERKK
jgi:geranylgeranyl diphosphate synthase type I